MTVHQSPFSSVALMAMIVRACFALYPGWSLQEIKRKLVLFVTAMRHRVGLTAFFLRMSLPQLDQVRLIHSDIIGLTQWPYINNAWTVEQRLDIIAEHYEILSGICPVLVRISQENPFALLDLSEYAAGVRIVIDRPAWFKREGELVMNIFKNELRVSSVAFTLGRIDGNYFMYLGACQGIHQGIPRDEMLAIYKELRNDFQGITARHLLLNILDLFATYLGAKYLLGIADTNRHHRHAFFGPYDPRQLLTNYNELWSEVGGTAELVPGFYKIPVPHATKNTEDIPSHKRAMYHRRQALLDQLGRMISERLGAVCHAI